MNNESIICIRSDRKDDFLEGKQVSLIAKGRKEVEEDNNYKQLVVYAIIQVEEGFIYYKRENETEGRLDSTDSIGFGGHVNREDYMNGSGNVRFMIENAFKRELKEELGINTIQYDRLYGELGSFYISGGEVEDKHLAIVRYYKLNKELSIKELKGEKGKHIKILDLNINLDKSNFDKWSKFFIKEYIQDVYKAYTKSI